MSGLVAGREDLRALARLIAMLKRRSSKGMNPRMAGIWASFMIGMYLLRSVESLL
jgi:hypothetical protein